MKRSWIAVARPRDWRGTLAKVGAIASWSLLGLIAILVDLPDVQIATWVVDAFWLRVGLICAWYYAARSITPLVYAALASAPVLIGKTIRLRIRGRSHRISVLDVERLRVELRPRGQIAVLVMRSGVPIDLCPLHWPGAAHLAYRISALVAKAQGRAAVPIESLYQGG